MQPLNGLPRLTGLVLAAALLLPGCAGLESQPDVEANALEGVAYFMPMKSFLLTVGTKDGKVESLEWSESAAYPDLSRTFVLRYRPHLIGRTTVKVSVGANGLLGVANTLTTDTAAALAAVTAAPASASFLPSAPTEECKGTARYVFRFEVPGADLKVCGGRVTATVLPAGGKPNKDTDPSAPTHLNGNPQVPGIFYRLNRAYFASASAQASDSNSPTGVSQTRLLFAPNGSPTMLLPFGRTLFAANDGKVQLADGVLQNYDQADDGELVALLKFPASILTAYFNAAGNVFSAFGERDRKEADRLAKELQLDILKFKIERCQEALQKGDKAALEALQCGSLGSK